MADPIASGAKVTAETAFVIGAANFASWHLQEVSSIASILLSLVSVVWIIVQCAKFLSSWKREWDARKSQGD